MIIMDTTLYFAATEESFEPSPQQSPQPERDFNVQWDFEPWDQPKSEPIVQVQKSPDWTTWKMVPGASLVYEKDRFGRLLRPKVVSHFAT